MGASRIMILLVSAVGAVGLALVVSLMLNRPSHAPVIATAAAAEPSRPQVNVLVAKRDLAIGTRLASGDLVWQAWPADALNAAFITDGRGPQTPVPASAPATAIVADKASKVADAATAAVAGGGPMEALYGAMVRETIAANEPILNSKLLRSGEGGYLAVVLDPGMRAVAVPVTVATSAGGFILPGDRVDVLQAHPTDAAANGGRAGFVGQVLLRNVKVLAIDQASSPQKNAESLVGAVATLEVREDQTQVLAMAKAQGEVVLALRPFGEANADGPQTPGGENTNNVSGAVRIIRSGQVSEVVVAQ